MTESLHSRIAALLERVIPFRYLSTAERMELAREMTAHELEPGEIIIRQGDPEDTRVYLIERGSVEALDRRGPAPVRVNVITAGHYFGEREPIFDLPRTYEVRATEACVCFSVSGDRFVRLLRDSPAFAQSLGAILRDKQRLFEAFDRFITEIARAVAHGHVDIHHFLRLYRDLEPALHPLAADPDRLDVRGLTYALRRLPENVTRTFSYLLADDLPQHYRKPDRLFTPIGTEARRRNVWEMMPGKNLVLLRTGLSDLMDLISCLCLYATEARKIRTRLHSSDALLQLRNAAAGDAEPSEDRALLESLPFSPQERQGLSRVWGTDALSRLADIAFHREGFTAQVLTQSNNYNSRNTELWTGQVGAATVALLGSQPNSLPSDTAVHIISSNTHSVTNCLSPYLRQHAEKILTWGRERQHPFLDHPWQVQTDLVYALAREFFAAHPAEREAAQLAEKASGIRRVRRTVSTGIQVQLVDTRRLSGQEVDPALSSARDDDRALLVNIDYAFGDQAEEIIRNLLLLFGRNLASINILGKAGALRGARGDVLVPSAFIEQTTDHFQPLPEPDAAAIRRLSDRLPGNRVHVGPLLTVAGTLLQNQMMLHFYRHIWGCIGLEMEGSAYYRQIQAMEQLGVSAEEIPLRLYYYVSDLPMESTASLAQRLREAEGIPPLYAITREILGSILACPTGT